VSQWFEPSGGTITSPGKFFAYHSKFALRFSRIAGSLSSCAMPSAPRMLLRR
jgi:hypothetical protein